MNLVAGTLYDPTGGAIVTKATSALLAMTAFDTTNLRLAFTVPPCGKVLIKMACALKGATTFPTVLLGVLDGSTVKGRVAPKQTLGNTAVATALVHLEAEFLVSGLTPGASLSYDAAYGVEVVVASTNIVYGGPNNTTTNDAAGGFRFEIWDPQPISAGAQLAVDSSGRASANVLQISGDTTAADNAEAFFDGTGYAGTNNVIPTVTNLTNAPTNGDLTAAMKASVNAEADTALSDYGALKPTTAGRTLDVTATGEAGIDWGNIGGPTTAVNLSGTTIKTATDVETDTQDIQARLPAALTAGGNMKSDMLALNGGTQSAADLKDFADTGYDPATHKVQGVVLTDTVTTYTGNTPQTGDSFARLGAPAGASVSADIAAVKGDTAAILADTNELQTDWANGGRLDNILDARASQASVDTIDGIVDAILVDTAEIGVAGAGLTNISLPDQAMNITGNIAGNLSGSVGSVTGLTASDVGAIKAKTDNLPPDPADASDIAGAFGTVNASLTTIAGYIDTEIAAILAAVDTEVAAIKAKTDNLPASPAATGDQMALTDAAIDAIIDEAVEGSTTLRQLLRGFAAALLGKVSGMDTNTPIFRDIDDTKDRITATTDADGNRSDVTLDLS